MIGVAKMAEGKFVNRIIPTATFTTVEDAQCVASGWSFRASLRGFTPVDYLAAEFNDDNQPTIIYPRKACPKR